MRYHSSFNFDKEEDNEVEFLDYRKELEKLFKIISKKRDVTNKKNDDDVLKVNKKELNKHSYLYKQNIKLK